MLENVKTGKMSPVTLPKQFSISEHNMLGNFSSYTFTTSVYTSNIAEHWVAGSHQSGMCVVGIGGGGQASL